MPPGIGNLANKHLSLQKFCILQCKYICSNSYLRFAALDLKEFDISHLLPVTLPITDRLMTNSSREKCAGIQAFIDDFQSSTFGVCSSFLFLVSVFPSYGA